MDCTPSKPASPIPSRPPWVFNCQSRLPKPANNAHSRNPRDKIGQEKHTHSNSCLCGGWWTSSGLFSPASGNPSPVSSWTFGRVPKHPQPETKAALPWPTCQAISFKGGQASPSTLHHTFRQSASVRGLNLHVPLAPQRSWRTTVGNARCPSLHPRTACPCAGLGSLPPAPESATSVSQTAARTVGSGGSLCAPVPQLLCCEAAVSPALQHQAIYFLCIAGVIASCSDTYHLTFFKKVSTAKIKNGSLARHTLQLMSS